MDLIESEDQSVVLRLSQDELVTLNNALNEILHGPETVADWEFHPRVGISREEAESLLRPIG
jgi:hypothetical protein